MYSSTVPYRTLERVQLDCWTGQAGSRTAGGARREQGAGTQVPIAVPVVVHRLAGRPKAGGDRSGGAWLLQVVWCGV